MKALGWILSAICTKGRFQSSKLVSLPGDGPEHCAIETCEIYFFHFSLFHAKPTNLIKRDLGTPAQDAARELASSWLREVN